jgi:hypothetical protein
MSLNNFNKVKELLIPSVTGTPTINKTQPIYLTSGDDSTTGTGIIVLDWSNISGPSDISIYDQNDNLLAYEIEELDTTNKNGLIWVYNSWVRDGTVQAKIAYGNGPIDQSMDYGGSNPWLNSQNATGVYHLNGGASDSINNNDGNLVGATDADGHFSGAQNFDGTDDYIGLGDVSELEVPSSGATIVGWYKPETGAQSSYNSLFMKSNGSTGGGIEYELRTNNDTPLTLVVYLGTTNGGGTTSTSTGMNNGTYYMTIFRYYDTGEAEVGIDGSIESTLNSSGDPLRNNEPVNIGARSNDGLFATGDLDAYRFFHDVKSDDWLQAEYDASKKGGRVFFSQKSGQEIETAGSIIVTKSSINQTNTNKSLKTSS